VNAALDLVPPEEATPAASAPTMPAPPEKKPVASGSTKPNAPEDERSAATQAPSIAQPRAPEPASEIGAGQPADGPIERSETELSMVGPTAAPEEADSRLAGFHASIEVWTVDPSGRVLAEKSEP
jgi:hypothetical protein